MARIVETYRGERGVSFQCRMPNFSTEGYNVNVTSPTYFGVTWNMTYSTQTRHFKVRLSRDLEETSPACICFSIYLKMMNGKEPLLHKNAFYDKFSMTECVLPLFSYLNTFRARLPPTEEVTIFFVIWKDISINTRSPKSTVTGKRKLEADEKTDEDSVRRKSTRFSDMKDLSILSDHFKDLLNSGEDHDVVVLVKDKQFKAHKNVLRIRSPVFAAMFRSDMLESATGTITIDDCDPDAFGEFLQYLYTGRVDISSVIVALGLYYAGDKYDVPRLKEIIVGFLKASFSTTTISIVILFAARHNEMELEKLAFEYFSKNLEKVLITAGWRAFLLRFPYLANKIILHAVKILNATKRATKRD